MNFFWFALSCSGWNEIFFFSFQHKNQYQYSVRICRSSNVDCCLYIVGILDLMLYIMLSGIIIMQMLKFHLSFSLCPFAALTQNASLQLSPGLPVGNSPGSKPGATVVVERVYIHGLPRFKSLGKFAHSFKVNVLPLPAYSNVRLPNIEVCFHR